MRPSSCRATSARTSVGYLFVAPFLLMFAGLFILPLLYAAYLSLFTERLIGGKAFAGFANYSRALGDDRLIGGTGDDHISGNAGDDNVIDAEYVDVDENK